MSRTYSLGCKQCEVEIWIGQKDYIYQSERHLAILQEFLFSHQRHHLEFYDDEASDFKVLNMPYDD